MKTFCLAMKKPALCSLSLVTGAVLMLALLLLAGCATSTPQSRIAGNPALFEALSEHDKGLVSSGMVREGMNQDAVFLAWGRPDRVSEGSRGGSRFETWTYLKSEPVRRVNVGVGYGYGRGPWGHPGYYGRHGYGRYGRGYDPFYHGGPTWDYRMVKVAEVEFVNNRVTKWELLR